MNANSNSIPDSLSPNFDTNSYLIINWSISVMYFLDSSLKCKKFQCLHFYNMSRKKEKFEKNHKTCQRMSYFFDLFKGHIQQIILCWSISLMSMLQKHATKFFRIQTRALRVLNTSSSVSILEAL